MSQGLQAPQEAGEDKEKDAPRSLGKGASLADSLTSAQRDPFQTSDLQNCHIINLCSFKPQSLWQSVTAAAAK